MIKTATALTDSNTELITCLFLILLLIFYLYKTENKYVMRFLVHAHTQNTRVPLNKNTFKSDLFMLIIVIVIVLIAGFKLVTFVVIVSDSMVPEFKRGDMVLTQSIFLDIDTNDIITFNVRNRNIAVTHRVIELQNGRIITMGDNNPYRDDYKTTDEMIIAKAITFNDHPLVIEDLGAFFITDYSVQGRITKYGDQFTFMKQLSETIRAWGYLITIIALFGYILSMKK